MVYLLVFAVITAIIATLAAVIMYQDLRDMQKVAAARWSELQRPPVVQVELWSEGMPVAFELMTLPTGGTIIDKNLCARAGMYYRTGLTVDRMRINLVTPKTEKLSRLDRMA